jgi:thiol-disulfide isomerase/thioredoxin
VKRNTVVTGVVLLVLAVFAWAGWGNYEYRKQAAERSAAEMASKGELAPGGDDAQASLAPLVGRPAPQFSLEDLSGRKVSLDDYKGKAVLINFWATWCGPCKVETPWLVDLRNQYSSKGFEILGVSTDDIDPTDPKAFSQEKKEIADFVDRMHMPYPVLIDGDSLSKPYGGLDAMPTSIFVDREGKIVAATMGITSKDDIEANIQKALKSSS